MKRESSFATEADLVAAFCGYVERAYNNNRNRMHRQSWTMYHETSGWDLLMVENGTGIQVGIEAKLSLNAKVLDQALPGRYAETGPDYRAVLVPSDKVQHHLGAIADQIGVHILGLYNSRGWPGAEPDWNISGGLPDETQEGHWALEYGGWHSWLPITRCKLPDYVPDVMGGHASPVALTEWKVKAIRLMIVLERRGHVTRADMKALGISPTRWTAASYGFLIADKERGGYVACGRTPDLRSQHPVNYAQVEADFAQWAEPAKIVI